MTPRKQPKMSPGIEYRPGPKTRTPYRVTVYDRRIGKRLPRRSFATLAEAKAWKRDREYEIDANLSPTGRAPTLNEYAEQFIDGARKGHIKNRSGDEFKPSAIRGYEYNLRLRVLPDYGHLRLSDIRTRDLQALVDRLVSEGADPAVVMTTITPLRALYKRAVSRGIVAHNPTRGLEMPAVRSAPRRFASPEEATRLLAALEPGDRPMWATALYAGLRRGELMGLQWRDVDLAGGVIHVRRGWDMRDGEVAPKSQKGRRKVPIASVLRDYLTVHKAAAGEVRDTDRLFGTPHQARQTYERAKKRWNKAGFLPLKLHDARHTCASFMIAAGVNAKALSEYMGHASIQITFDLYGHLFPGNEDEAAGLLDAYLARAAGGSTVVPTLPTAAPSTPVGQ